MNIKREWPILMSQIVNEHGTMAIMYAMLLPAFTLLLSLTIDGSYLLHKKARLADVVTESLVSASTHRYDDQSGGQSILTKNLNIYFPNDNITLNKLTLTVNQNGHVYSYRHVATAKIGASTILIANADHGFAGQENIGYRSPTLNQDSKLQPPIFVQDQTTLVDTGVGIDAEGKIWVWGFRGSGQQGNGNLAVSSGSSPAPVNIYSNGKPAKMTKVTGGIYHLLALDENGDAWAWGYNRDGEGGAEVCGRASHSAIPCKVMSNVVDIVAGEYTSAMLTTDGEIYFLGHCGYSQCGNGSSPTKVTIPMKVNLAGEKAVVLGGGYEGTLAVTVNAVGEYSAWGFGDNEGCGLGATQYVPGGTGPIGPRQAANGSYSQCHHGVQDFKGLTAWPYRIKGLKKYASQIKYLAGGQGWGAALLRDGRVIGWGTNYYLGKGWTNYVTAPHTNLDVSEPVVVFSNVAELQVRFIGGALLTNDNKLYTFGGAEQYHVYGKNLTLRATNVASFSVGKEHLFYNDMDGKLFGVGYCAGNKFLSNGCATHPLYAMDPGSGTYGIRWPGVELDFTPYGINVGGQGDPTPSPIP